VQAVILGKKWKSEPDGVKAYYKELAEEIKAQHKQNYPDYQYTPRKSSEKKRRMTPRRAAEMARAQTTASTELQSEENLPEVSSSASADVSELLGISRPKHLQQFVEDEDGNVDFTLPTHNTTKLHATIHHHRGHLSAASQPFDPANERQLSSSIPLYVQNDQDFVDSLVDWDGIAADTALVRDASAEEMAQLVGIEVGDGYLALSGEDQRALFEAELERTMRYFG
jgi:HMG (high mobility group) box